MKHTKAEWLEAAEALIERYKREGFENADIRGTYRVERSCPFCAMCQCGRGGGLNCARCIYYLLEFKTCSMIGPEIPESYSSYKVVSKRRKWLAEKIVPRIKSIPADYGFFKQSQEE